jgi:pyruvate,orthophosphate dikinase
MEEKKYVYAFHEGRADMKFLLGGKGANLCEMTNLGLPVPPGFTISTDACRYYSSKSTYPPGMKEQVNHHLKKLEEKTGKKLGDINDPLLVSVRSGAAFSMPGMMDTVLNLGLNDQSVKGLAKQTQNQRFAYDSYRRFIQMFGKVVMKVDGQLFEDAITDLKKKRGAEHDVDLSAEDLQELISAFKNIIKRETNDSFPQEPEKQLDLAIGAVFESWNNKRARVYRKINKISDDLGTAVNVQTMVFGNKGNDSGTGVAFTRDPATGEKVFYGDYLFNAQGEDVVAGIRHTEPISKLKEKLPKAYQELEQTLNILEKRYRDMCDTEFTIEQGKLYMLQTRIGKRTAAAALKIATDMVKEGLINKEEAVMRINPEQLDQLLHPRFDPSYQIKALAKGLNASPGAAVGKVVFDADLAEKLGNQGEKVILTRWETTPDDLHGMVAAQGILTSHGGKTSHAAVVARGMGKPCVAGCAALEIDTEKRLFNVNGQIVREGEIISIDGTTGNVVLGAVPLVPPTPSSELKTILSWADEFRKLGVRTNADTPEDAAKAREFKAEGIGLARTEHMFLGDRLPIVQQMILGSETEKQRALQELLKVQRQDFKGIFAAMDGLPVTIRLLDPPLHEFLPSQLELEVEVTRMEYENAPREELAKKQDLLHRVQVMTEANPMLGLRGCRLGIMHPDIYKMQSRAIMEAACELKKEGKNPQVEIMIPLVSVDQELEILRKETMAVCEEVIKEQQVKVEYKIGTMIELPRAAITADEIAKHAEFFSFGTNDLTQTTFGFSRDDIEGKFLARYLERKILPVNPFETLDKGVIKLISTAKELGRKTNPNLKLGICGEHGGDPDSVHACHQIGLTYVSCSPYRVPLARLAAAQAAIEEKRAS